RRLAGGTGRAVGVPAPRRVPDRGRHRRHPGSGGADARTTGTGGGGQRGYRTGGAAGDDRRGRARLLSAAVGLVLLRRAGAPATLRRGLGRAAALLLAGPGAA